MVMSFLDKIASDGSENRSYIPSGLLLQWHITERCDHHCLHCYQDDWDDEELPFDDLIAILEQYKEALRSWRSQSREDPVRGHITLTGGEPFLRDDFLSLLYILASHRKYFSFGILTNGSYIDPFVVGRLRELRPAFVQLSIDGGESTHDRMRGVGDYQRVVKAVKLLVHAHIRTIVSFTAHRDNYREFPDVVKIGQKLGVQRVWADRMIPWGNGQGMRQKVLTPEQTREFIHIMSEEQMKARHRWFHRTEVAMHRALQFLANGKI